MNNFNDFRLLVETKNTAFPNPDAGFHRRNPEVESLNHRRNSGKMQARVRGDANPAPRSHIGLTKRTSSLNHCTKCHERLNESFSNLMSYRTWLGARRNCRQRTNYRSAQLTTATLCCTVHCKFAGLSTAEKSNREQRHSLCKNQCAVA